MAKDRRKNFAEYISSQQSRPKFRSRVGETGAMLIRSEGWELDARKALGKFWVEFVILGVLRFFVFGMDRKNVAKVGEKHSERNPSNFRRTL